MIGMRKSRLILVGLAATALLALASAGASARSFSVNERNFELVWNNGPAPKTFFTFAFGFHVIECGITLLGSFTGNTIAKERTVAKFRINHVLIESICQGGEVRYLAETLPWEGFYQSFAGALPNITAINVSIRRVAFRITPIGELSCLWQTSEVEPALGIFRIAGGRIESFRLEERTEIAFVAARCPYGGKGVYSGTAAVLNLPATRSITLSLI